MTKSLSLPMEEEEDLGVEAEGSVNRPERTFYNLAMGKSWKCKKCIGKGRVMRCVVSENEVVSLPAGCMISPSPGLKWGKAAEDDHLPYNGCDFRP